ncbi:MAG TPA: hypothetical protein VFE56_13545, partial [Candidatus Binataceae bacterium]|nr:hypothetical protein [Candidatus Binataceae bacterium]
MEAACGGALTAGVRSADAEIGVKRIVKAVSPEALYPTVGLAGIPADAAVTSGAVGAGAVDSPSVAEACGSGV